MFIHERVIFLKHILYSENIFIKLHFARISRVWGNFTQILYIDKINYLTIDSHIRVAEIELKTFPGIFTTLLRFHFYFISIQKIYKHNNIYFLTKAPTCTGDASIKVSFFSLHPFTRYILNYSQRRTFLIFFSKKYKIK